MVLMLRVLGIRCRVDLEGVEVDVLLDRVVVGEVC
jgi:hypothetical protein